MKHAVLATEKSQSYPKPALPAPPPTSGLEPPWVTSPTLPLFPTMPQNSLCPSISLSAPPGQAQGRVLHHQKFWCHPKAIPVLRRWEMEQRRRIPSLSLRGTSSDRGHPQGFPWGHGLDESCGVLMVSLSAPN